MKTHIRFIFAAAILLALATSCLEELPVNYKYDDYVFSGLDSEGGAWKTVLITDPSQIEVPVPQSTSSATYQNELNAVKEANSNLSKNQKDAIAYWTSNPIIRWNEIALELAAKYNLIPGPNPDNTYTLPDPANPGKVPYFPFAHPPYTVRALAYLSVAQYDGLVVGWNYKFQYNRPSPYKVDNAIVPGFTNNDVPAYPSDGAIVTAVSKTILSAMFPLEQAYINELAEEHLASLKWAGLNVESDVAAGTHIGSEIAKLALERAATDGMRSAQVPKPVSDSIKNVAYERFGWSWDNMETPQRPVGLTPMYGNVKLWLVPNTDVVMPPPPPVPGSAEFNKHADELKRLAKNRTESQRKIANWWNDGIGSYTPPGHWNRIAKEDIVRHQLNPLRSARIFAYLNMAMMDAGIACWAAKYHYHYPRPVQTIPGFKTILGTPNFPAYTSGHSTFSSAAAEVLAEIFPGNADIYRKKAVEAGESRIYGGIHYRFDSEEGIKQGKAVASYVVEAMRNDGAN
ncbi:phosphatase PAP2 family protein [Negadavirga shengliensis]|uniref:Phosphatase PAP2 family protein n=1 Tax=Negadavirga shengliensis TaxID=1389218 RepID=A0ABV9T839_9BACT